jgi:uncharacterized protein (TIGR00725 family)
MGATGWAPYIGVVGAGDASQDECAVAREIGQLLAARGAVVVCGGLGGVMEAAARGVAEAGGTVIGLLPGDDRHAANAHLTVAIPTGIGEMRNALIARAADALIAVGGEYGTLSEIALALRAGTPVVGVATWDLPDVVTVDTAARAVDLACELAHANR